MEIDHTLRTYQGGCHCGAVRYEATTDLTQLLDCNCSHCRRVGWVMQSVPAERFALLSGEADLKSYRFNTEQIEHLFCSRCGIHPFSRGSDDKGNTLVMLNVNCLEGLPVIDRTGILHWDGLSQ